MQSVNTLTKQELAVLTLLAAGWRNSKIADELCISTRTVESHLYHIFDKLGVSSRTEAALYAVRIQLNATPSPRTNTFDHFGIESNLE